LTVIFLLLPLTIWTGFAMSPALTSVFPALATLSGGRQSARTIHFFVAAALIVFLVGHVSMVALSGFTRQVRAMITGQPAAERGEA
jgi:thiosulfate reductase cytochrome b subunit